MTLTKVPKRSKAIVLRKAEAQSGQYKFDAVLEDRDIPPLEDGQVLVKIEAAGFNHREVSLLYVLVCATILRPSQVWTRKGLYPGITIGSVYGADGAGALDTI